MVENVQIVEKTQALFTLIKGCGIALTVARTSRSIFCSFPLIDFFI